MTAEEAVRSEHQRQGVTQVSVANAITSLRLCSEIDWREFVESVSLVEHALRRDPAGVYGRMDFLSRDQQRHAVEADRRAERGSAGAAGAEGGRERARRRPRAARSADRAAHVGYHLVGPGRADLEADVALSAAASARACGASRSAHPTLLYLGSIAAVTAAPARGRRLWLRRRRRDSAATLAVALALLARARARHRHRVRAAAASRGRVGPRRLPRLDFSDGVPEDARTMVVVPTLLDQHRGASPTLLEHLEVLAHGNLDPRIHFAILERLRRRADRPTRDEDGADSVGGARRDPRSQPAFGAGTRRSVLPVSSRAALESPRARLDGLGAQARQDRGVQPAAARRDATRRSRRRSASWTCCRSVRYCITLDTDTRLPRDAAKSLIGIIAHPLQPAAHSTRAPAGSPRATRILQPRVSVTMASAAGSLFARLYAGHTGVDPYTTAVSDAYQDLFDEGIFTGKGLYDVDAFVAGAARPRAREHAAVARPLRGAVRAHGARHRRRSRRRLPVERARAREAAAPLGARRLADSAAGCCRSCRRDRAGSATGFRSSRAGRSSTTCGAA